MSLEQEAADLLERAADGFESGRYYWTRGTYYRPVFGHPAYCSLGALAHEAGWSGKQVSDETFEGETAVAEAVRALAAQVSDWDYGAPGVVVSWNDALSMDEKYRLVTRGKGSVIEAMKRAAKELHNKAGETV